MISNYLNSKGQSLNRRAEPAFPKQERPTPKRRDYDRGVWRRYFLVSSNGSGTIYEVTQGTYDKFSGSRFYNRFTINWLVSGPEEDVFNSAGYPIRSGVKDTNERTLKRFEQQYPSIRNLIPSPLQFWQDGDN